MAGTDRHRHYRMCSSNKHTFITRQTFTREEFVTLNDNDTPPEGLVSASDLEYDSDQADDSDSDLDEGDFPVLPPGQGLPTIAECNVPLPLASPPTQQTPGHVRGNPPQRCILTCLALADCTCTYCQNRRIDAEVGIVAPRLAAKLSVPPASASQRKPRREPVLHLVRRRPVTDITPVEERAKLPVGASEASRALRYIVTPEIAAGSLIAQARGMERSGVDPMTTNKKGCWLSQGRRQNSGHVVMTPILLKSGALGIPSLKPLSPRPKNASQYVHRMAARAWKPWQYQERMFAGGQVSHLCHEPNCCNPDHLTVESQGDNTRRRKCADASFCFCEQQPECIF